MKGGPLDNSLGPFLITKSIKMRSFSEQELRSKSKSLLDQGIDVVALSNGAIYQANEAGIKTARMYSKKYALKSYTFKGRKVKSSKS